MTDRLDWEKEQENKRMLNQGTTRGVLLQKPQDPNEPDWREKKYPLHPRYKSPYSTKPSPLHEQSEIDSLRLAPENALANNKANAKKARKQLKRKGLLPIADNKSKKNKAKKWLKGVSEANKATVIGKLKKKKLI